MPEKTPRKEPKKITALVYFHGMGDQKRYEEVSRLVDALDRYDHESQNRGFRGIKAELESPKTDTGREVGYINSIFTNTKNLQPARAPFRFYEAYWANLTAGGVPTKDVLGWLLKQSTIPLKALFLPWRALPRLKRAVLMEKVQSQRMEIDKNDLKHLLERYDKFENWDARRQYPKGTLRDFIDFLHDGQEDVSRVKRLTLIAQKWRFQYVVYNLFSFFFLFTILLAAGLIMLGLFAIVAFFLKEATPFTPTWVTNILGEDALDPTKSANVLLAISAVLAALRIPYFLREYMGDVYFWATYEETAEKHQKRRAILTHCANYVEHVLRTDCERVVIVAHSLGSTIAFDTILELERRNQALSKSSSISNTTLIPLKKIQHFITMGSPIDKIHYFFENQTSNYHRYNRIVEDIRGDISTSPFLQAKKPHIHWINFWDKADIISGSLQTPEGKMESSLRVDNHQISSFHFPFPGEAHLAYFENKKVIKTIYQSLFNNDYNFHTISAQKGKKDYSSQNIGLGEGTKFTQPAQLLILLLPWLVAAYLIIRSLEKPSIEPLFLLPIYGDAVILILWWLTGKFITHLKGQINGLIPTRKKQNN